jgi:membrane protein
MAAAGCAVYATLALFPAISMLISVGGLILHPALAERQLTALSGLLPAPAFRLIEGRVYHLAHQSRGALSLRLLAGLLLTFWSSSTGSKSMLSAVNLFYGATERRPIPRFQAIGLAMTLGAITRGILAASVLLVLPGTIRDLG